VNPGRIGAIVRTMSMDVSALGSVYLGGVRVDTLARTGQVTSSPGTPSTFLTPYSRKESSLIA